jgi:hypothetical protein
LSFIGIVLHAAYRLRRHLWAAWPLSRWLGLLALVAAVGVLPRWQVSVALVAVWLLYVVLLWWAGRRRFTHFQAVPPSQLFRGDANPALPVRVEEMVPIQASGLFTVEGKAQTYIELDARIQTVETREHIVLAEVHPSRFLFLGRWPEFELGWWYIFIRPTDIQTVEAGNLHVGLYPRPAIRVVYALDEETQETAYLSAADVRSLRRIWDDLVRDAPSGAVPQSRAQERP